MLLRPPIPKVLRDPYGSATQKIAVVRFAISGQLESKWNPYSQVTYCLICEKCGESHLIEEPIIWRHTGTPKGFVDLRAPLVSYDQQGDLTLLPLVNERGEH